MPGSRSRARSSPGDWVWKLARGAVRTFYRIERVGGPLPDGPLLLLANHPNTLVDPALIQATAGCGIRFLAKSTLFARHPLSWLVRGSGAIPVYRKMDPGVDTSRNVEMFAAVEAAFAAGEAVCLFPEGISHSEGRLEPLRTGAARMVLSSAAGGHPVTVVPVGLNFEHVARFRSRVTVLFGRPFGTDDLAAAYAADAQAAVRELTERIERRLRRLMVEAEPRHDLPLVMRIDHLYTAARGVSRDPRERVIRRRVIAAGMAQLRERDPERLADITASVGEYDASLARFGLRDHDIDRRIPFAQAARFTVREGLLALVLLPVTVLSLALFALPYQVTALVSRFAPRSEEPRHLGAVRRHGRLRRLDRRHRGRGGLADRRGQRPAGGRRRRGPGVRRRRRLRARTRGAAHRARVLRATADPARSPRPAQTPARSPGRRPGPGARMAASGGYSAAPRLSRLARSW